MTVARSLFALLVLSVAVLAQPPRPAIEALDRAAVKGITGLIDQLARAGCRDEAELLLAGLDSWGLDGEASAKLRAGVRERLAKAGKRKPSASLAREAQRLIKKISRDLRRRSEADQRAQATIILALDSESEAAHEILGHEQVDGRWLDEEGRGCATRRGEILAVMQRIRSLEVPLEVSTSRHPLIARWAGEGLRIRFGDLDVHTNFPEVAARRILRDAIRALALSKYIVNGIVELPPVSPSTYVWFDSKALYDGAAKAAIAADELDELYAKTALSSGGYFQRDGTGVLFDQSENLAVASLFGYLRRFDGYFDQTQAVFQAGHLNWISRVYLGIPLPGMFWSEESVSDTGRPKYDRDPEAEAERELLIRMAEGGLAGSRAYLRFLLERGEVPVFASLLVEEVGMLTGVNLLTAVHMVEYLQERGDFTRILESTAPQGAEVGSYPDLCRKALGSLAEFDGRWCNWLGGTPVGVVQRLGGSRKKRELSREERRLLAHLDQIRKVARGLMTTFAWHGLTLVDSISAGCSAHARYLALNPKQLEAWPAAHEEYSDAEGFSPEGCWAGLNSVIAPGVADGIAAVDGWMATFYHRLPLLEPGLIGIGFGLEEGIAVLDSGSLVVEDGSTWISVWPPPNAKDMPLQFQPELPNPVPGEDQSSWGFPISLQCSSAGEARPTRGSMTLHLGDAQGPAVDCHFSSPSAPTNPELAPAGAFCLIPKKALKPAARYTVTAEIEGLAPLTWSFQAGR